MRYAEKAAPGGEEKPRPVDETTPSIRKICLVNITATGARGPVRAIGLPESKLTDIRLENVKIACEQGLLIRDARGVTLKER